MALTRATIGWHAASIGAGGLAVFAAMASNKVDVYAIWNAMNKIVADVTTLLATLAPVIAIFGAAYRTWNAKQVPTDAVAVQPYHAPSEIGGVNPVPPGTIGASAVVTGKIVGAMLIGALLLAGMDRVSAADVKKAVSPLVATAPCPLIFDPLKLCGVLTGDLKTDAQRVSDRIRLAKTDDIDYAIAKATAANTAASTVRLMCLNAIKAAHDQASGAGLKKPDGTDWVRPDPAALTIIEDVAELVDNLSPQGKLFTSCAGAAQMLKVTTLQVINAFVTGGAAIVAGAPVGL